MLNGLIVLILQSLKKGGNISCFIVLILILYFKDKLAIVIHFQKLLDTLHIKVIYVHTLVIRFCKFVNIHVNTL